LAEGRNFSIKFFISRGKRNFIQCKRDKIVNKKILENKASLCEIILEDFIVKIDMNKDSSKYIRINSENFKVVDLRFHSKFNNEESTPLIFMYSEDQENPEKRTSVKGFKDLSPKKPTLMKSSKSYDPRLEVIKDKIERILDIKILINEEKKYQSNSLME
jgi:hypothetical protein